MGRIIFSVVVLVLLTILIVMNLEPTTSVNLFGARFDKVPVVAVAMLSFAVGVVYSLFLYIGQSLHRSSRERLAQRHRDIEERERKLAASQGKTEPAAPEPSPDPSPEPQAGEEPQAGAESRRSRFFRFFR
jgi:uncharacterized integral membrane protein